MEDTNVAAEKPVLFADTRSDAEKFDPNLHRGHLDPSRIPGYSEIVQANDIAKSDPLVFRDRNSITQEEAYRQIGADPQELDVEFQWLPISGAGGGPSDAQVRVLDRYTTQEGFRIATREDLERQPWFKGMPPLGRVAEDGSIRRGADVALFVRSGEVARNWEAFKHRQAREFEGVPSPDSSAPEAWFEKGEVETVTVTH
jgi:hypothetical protein